MRAAAPLLASHSRYTEARNNNNNNNNNVEQERSTTATQRKRAISNSKFYTLDAEQSVKLREQLALRASGASDDASDRVIAEELGDVSLGDDDDAQEEQDIDDDANLPDGVDMRASLSSSAVLPMPHLGARRRVEVAERLEKAHAPYWNAVATLHEIRRYKTVARKLQVIIYFD